MYTYAIKLVHGMFGDYWTVIETNHVGGEKIFPYFDSENDAKAFVARQKEYNNDY